MLQCFIVFVRICFLKTYPVFGIRLMISKSKPQSIQGVRSNEARFFANSSNEWYEEMLEMYRTFVIQIGGTNESKYIKTLIKQHFSFLLISLLILLCGQSNGLLNQGRVVFSSWKTSFIQCLAQNII